MSPRVFCPALCLSVVLTAGFAQTDKPKPAPAEAPKPAAVRETPPDQKAYTDATRAMDPTKKIEALEKFKADFPRATCFRRPISVILRTLVKQFPSQKGRIIKQAKAIYDHAEARDKGSVANEIASEYRGCRGVPRKTPRATPKSALPTCSKPNSPRI